jgi:hypothetical protein
MKLRKRLLLLTVISIIIGILLPTSIIFPQNQLHVYDVPGGGGSSSSNKSSTDNIYIYVLGGAIILGVVVYAILKDKKKEKEDDSDTTSAVNNINLKGLASFSNNFDVNINKVKDTMPVDLLIGIENEKAYVSDRRYVLGILVKF